MSNANYLKKPKADLGDLRAHLLGVNIKYRKFE